MKICSKCKEEKDDIFFNRNKSKKDGLSTECKSCIKIYKDRYDLDHKTEIRDHNKQYYELNKNQLKENQRIYNLINAERKSINDRNYYFDNKDILKVYKKSYYLKNKNKLQKQHRMYKKNRKIVDISYKLRSIISTSICLSLKRNNSSKMNKSCLNYLSYTMQELREHLEKQFESWMAWSNYGRYNFQTWDDNNVDTWTWNIDHIRPHSTFKYTSMEDEEFKQCWELDNLRPLSAKSNYLDGINRIRHKLI